MINIDRLIADFEDCIGWPYASPGSNDERGIDCSGMFVRAFRLQGQRIRRGSNVIWRRHLESKGRIHSIHDLQPGMAVFRWKAASPAGFSDNEGDFFRIGLVTSVHPLRIVHASSDSLQVKADSRIGQWKFWGTLAAADISEETAFSAGLPADALLRRGDHDSSVRDLQRALRAAGYDLEIDGRFGRITQECVKSFQASHALTRDSIVGPLTWAALKEAVHG